MKQRHKNILGWTGVSITILFSSLWAYWGSFENFHEGWYEESLLLNLMIFLVQYLLFSIFFTFLACISLRWKKRGLILHILIGMFCIYFFSGANFQVLGMLIIIPFALLGLMYYIGEPQPRRWAYRLIIFVPLVVTLAISIPLGIRVSHRIDDRDLSMRIIEGNEVTLAWAPRGPGWPDVGISWEDAQRLCAHLSEDGLTLSDDELNIWRLPTVDEAVRSMMLHGESSMGTWDPEEEKAYYSQKPDKESPLWDLGSKVIYYWTSDTSKEDPEQAYIIVYDGGVFDKRKSNRQDYQSFRAVKELP